MFRDHGGGKEKTEKSHVSDSFSFQLHPAMNSFYFHFKAFSAGWHGSGRVKLDAPAADILFFTGRQIA
jgi:hypothetical protein